MIILRCLVKRMSKSASVVILYFFFVSLSSRFIGTRLAIALLFIIHKNNFLYLILL